MTQYEYQRVGTRLFADLAQRLKGGQSVVLLAPRYGGKRYSMRRVLASLQEAGDSGTVALLPIGGGIGSVQALGKLILDALDYTGAVEGIFDAVDRHWFESKSPVTLLVPNLDVLRHELVQLFLQGLRVRVNEGRIVVLLGGDQNFREFVYGPNSEFNCATQFMLTGFDRAEFMTLVDQYRRLLRFHITPEAAEVLFEVTGGQAFLLRALVARAVEERGRSCRESGAALTEEEARELPFALSISSTTSRGLFAPALETLFRNPDCRHSFEQLLDSQETMAPLEPGALELAGIAVREKGFLNFATPMTASFFRNHFNPRRRADLAAALGDWDDAFARYRALPQHQWLRPDSAGDRNEISRVVQSLTMKIAAAPSEIQAFLPFRNAMRCLLGFAEVSWWTWNRGWQRDPSRTVGSLEDPELVPSACFPEAEAYGFAQALPRETANCSTWIDLPAPWNRIALAVALAVPGGQTPEIVVFSDVALNRSISQDRMRMAGVLVDAFLPAFERARYNLFLQTQIEMNSRHMAVFDAILDTIDDSDLDLKTICRRVARALRRLGYRRVLICLVDAARKRIQGVWDDSDQPHVDVARMTNYSLDDSSDLQPVVIMTRAPFLTSDASKEKLASRKVVAATSQRALAIVPMLDRNGNAIGTIHVEREDWRVPSALEIDSLTAFGKRLALVLDHGERTMLINQALDRIPDPIAIADPSPRWRYANAAAAASIGIPKGWRHWGHATPVDDSESIKRHLMRALSSPPGEDYLVAKQIQGLRSPEDRYHLTTTPIRDASKNITGAVVVLREFTKVNAMVTVVGKIIGAGTVGAALQAILDAMKTLGHDRTRIYLQHKQDGQELLVSCRAIGLESDRLQEFNAEQIVLTPRHASHHSWSCIEGRKGKIFTWRPNGNEGEVIQTLSGLDAEVVTVPDQASALGKKAGDYWMDLPLIAADGRTLGKLATHIDQNLDPQQFWIVQLLAAFAAVVIETFSTHEQQEDERKKWEEQVYQTSLAKVAHHLLNRVIALDGLHYRYQKAERDLSKIENLNRDFETLLKLITATVKRARDFLLPPQPKRQEVNLSPLCRAILSSHLPAPEIQSEFRCDGGGVVWADPELLSLALSEILDNARKALVNVPEPKVLVQLECDGAHATIRVHDNGCGIDRTDFDEVFEDFNSAWPGDGKRGTGLGLGWIRRVFQAHGGSVRIDRSKFGQGVCFTLELPLTNKEGMPCGTTHQES